MTKRKSTRYLVVHCTATPEGKHFDVDDIRRMHKELGWSDIGYHFLILLDGTVQIGRALDQVGAHVAGYNGESVGVSYVGGIDKKGNPKDTRTPAQTEAMRNLLADLRLVYPKATVLGHRDFPGVKKACPCFNVIDWWNGYPPVTDTHTVVKGDTLYSLAREYNTTVKKLGQLNGLESLNDIYVGQVLKVA